MKHIRIANNIPYLAKNMSGQFSNRMSPKTAELEQK